MKTPVILSARPAGKKTSIDGQLQAYWTPPRLSQWGCCHRELLTNANEPLPVSVNVLQIQCIESQEIARFSIVKPLYRDTQRRINLIGTDPSHPNPIAVPGSGKQLRSNTVFF